MDTAVQLYTLRDLDAPLPEQLGAVSAAGFDGVEFAGLDGASPAALRDRLDELGLRAGGGHVGVEALAAAPADVAERYRALGATALAVPYLPPARFADGDAVAAAAAELADPADVLGTHGLGLAYHNHDHEFAAVDGTTGLERLVAAAPGLALELDVGWARAAGADPVALLERHADRVDRVHLKDVVLDTAADRGGRAVELGAGVVDVEGCIAAAERARQPRCVFEHDDPADPAAALERAAAVLC